MGYWFQFEKSNIKEVAERVCSESMDVQLQRRKNIQNLYNTYFRQRNLMPHWMRL